MSLHFLFLYFLWCIYFLWTSNSTSIIFRQRKRRRRRRRRRKCWFNFTKSKNLQNNSSFWPIVLRLEKYQISLEVWFNCLILSLCWNSTQLRFFAFRLKSKSSRGIRQHLKSLFPLISEKVCSLVLWCTYWDTVCHLKSKQHHLVDTWFTGNKNGLFRVPIYLFIKPG